MLGDEFGLSADIFSLGVIFCEISSRQIVQGEVFKVPSLLTQLRFSMLMLK
jgi:hypothetical protein